MEYLENEPLHPDHPDQNQSVWPPKLINFDPETPLPGTALTCLNSIKHGGTARTLFIPGEDPQTFYKLLAESFETYQPATHEDSALVNDSVFARWHLWRRQRAYTKREFEIYNAGSQEDSPTVSGLRELELFDRYRIQAERALKRALTNVQNIKKTAASELKWREQHELAKARFDLDLQRFELRKAQDARVAEKKTLEAEADARIAKSCLALAKKNDARKVADHAVILENNQWVIRQHSVVSEVDGVPSVMNIPNNKNTQDLIGRRHTLTVPPVKVVRHFYFRNGIIPQDYLYLFDGVNRAACTIPSEMPTPGLRLEFSFEAWQTLANLEAQFAPKQEAA
jgi:hypothetical protein